MVVEQRRGVVGISGALQTEVIELSGVDTRRSHSAHVVERAANGHTMGRVGFVFERSRETKDWSWNEKSGGLVVCVQSVPLQKI
uniref:Uncharacterized protein n=1 Tax=Knipowitschia caucasica TaxID=637954 RepID=A0AAV2LSM0_KNICA